MNHKHVIPECSQDIYVPKFIYESRYLSNVLDIAMDAHNGQVRKVTNEPYIVHPISVAQKVYGMYPKNDTAIAAALLHDVVEDTIFNYDSILQLTDANVIELVFWLTKVTNNNDGSRATRSKLEAIRLSKAPFMAQEIKLADIADNLSDINAQPKSFATRYIAEKEYVLKLIKKERPFYRKNSKGIRLCQDVLDQIKMV